MILSFVIFLFLEWLFFIVPAWVEFYKHWRALLKSIEPNSSDPYICEWAFDYILTHTSPKMQNVIISFKMLNCPNW